MSKRFCGLLLASSIFAGLFTSVASAQVTTEDPASVLVFPKIIADGSRDTFVQVSNHSNAQVRAKCFYVSAQLTFPQLPPGPFNPPLWLQTAFDITLTAQQPTNWLVSAGRPADVLDPNCRNNPAFFDCYGAGFDPGRVPAVTSGFVGELTCIEVDAGGDPVSGNHLTGEVTLKDLATGDVSKYSAIGLAGFENNDGDGELILGQEYAACPQRWLVGHTTDGSEVPAVGAGSSLRTDVTVVPCTHDFENEVPAGAVLQLLVTNEFEQTLSTSHPVDCWLDSPLGALDIIFRFSILGTPTAQTRIDNFSGGVILIAEEFRSTGGTGPLVASAAGNAYAQGTAPNPDIIQIP